MIALMWLRRYWYIAVGAVLVVGLVVALMLWRRGRVDPLPPAVRTAVTNEKADRARIDSQLVAATQEAEAAQRRQEIAVARAKQLERAARRSSDRADSLAHEAERAATAQDSARYYHQAYDARTAERDTLRIALVQKDTALDAANTRIAALTRAVASEHAGRQRADSVLDAVVASVTVCTVPGTFGRVKCPTRTQSLVAGAVLAVAGKLTYDAARSGRLKIPLVSRAIRR